MSDLLSDEAALAAWGALEERVPHTAANGRTYHHYRPLADAAERIITEAQDKDRIYTGTAEFDEQMRGIGAGHLFVITGYSHSGKTQWLLKMLRYNKNKRIALFIPDEPDTLVLAKLASIESGIPARDLEQRVGDNDHEAIRLLRDTAIHDFPNLIVFDRPLTAQYMREGLDEARDVWGEKEDLIVIDFVDLVQVGESVPAKFDFLKGVVAREKTRMVAVHQTSRTAGADGRKMTISSGNYGGEQHATFMVGVRRKKSQLMAQLNELEEKRRKGSDVEDDIAVVKGELRVHEYTITVNLVKNKRPGGGLVDDIDLELDTSTGRLHDLDGDLPNQYLRDLDRLRSQRREAFAAGDHTANSSSWAQTEIEYEGEF